MRWFDRYIKDFEEYCHECGFDSDDCDGNCRWCDVLHDYMVDDIGVHDEIWPYDFTSQEEYAVACAFANEADEIVSNEEVCCWSGDPGFIQGISSPAIDPHDFHSTEQYEDALYRHLFKEAVTRHPIIPHTEFWFRAYVNFLKASESVFCADKSILGLLEELNYNDSIQDDELYISADDELDREIRYSSWKEPRNPPRYSNDYSAWRSSFYFNPYLPPKRKEIQRYKKKYTEAQFRNDLFYHYPELFTLINGILQQPSLRRNSTQTQTEENLQEYLDDVLLSAFYLHDLYNFSIEESVQNGLIGLINGLKNGFWKQNSPYHWEREDYLNYEIRINIIQHSPETLDHFGFAIDRKIAKVLESIISERSQLQNLSVYDLCDDYRVTDHDKYVLERIHAFFRSPIHENGSLACSNEEFTDFESNLFKTEAATLLHELLNTLPGRLRKCLVMRYGLETGIPMTLDEVGYELSLSRERVRQLEKKAIEWLKRRPWFADLCELTGNPIPEGAAYSTSHSDQPPAAKKEYFRYSLQPDRHYVLNQTLEEDPNRTRISSIYHISPMFYRPLEERDIIYLDQLLSLTEEQLREIPRIPMARWSFTLQHLQKHGIEPSAAMINFVRPYRPSTGIALIECSSLSFELRLEFLIAGITKVDQLQAMSVSELKAIRNITARDWRKIDKALRQVNVLPSESIMELAGTTY